LGPLLFLLFINDLPSSAVYSQPFLFADDCKLYGSMHDNLQSDVDSFLTWSKCNSLFFNNDKVHYIRFGGVVETTVMLDDEPINHSLTVKDLGVMINSNISWVSHISENLTNVFVSYMLFVGISRLTHLGLPSFLFTSHVF
jgi:hypothetical protein